MTAWIGAAVLVSGFVLLLQKFGLVKRSRDVVAASRRSFDVLRDPSLSDEAKETALQKEAKWLLVSFVVLTLGGAAAFLIPLGVIWAGGRIGWVSLESVLDVTISPPFLILSGVLIVAVFVFSRKQPAAGTGYSRLDRFLHRLSFRTRIAQIALADLGDRMVTEPLAACRTDRPVFITALPRAGTTLLLERFAGLPEFASHCYRDMPFVLTPWVWDRFSSSFQRTGGQRERAHGDGMRIDFDSPEALEEIVWMTFWKDRYTPDRILPWGLDRNGEFETFLHNHMCKIKLLRGSGDMDSVRYVSKNNLNIARIPLLLQLFPDCTVLVPFREPVQHACSLLKQHVNFMHIHEHDRFVRDYMRAIGHFDFGRNLRPVDFGGWLDANPYTDTETLNFWLSYWIAAYRHILEHKAHLVLASYDALCRNPAAVLSRLAEAAGCMDKDALVSGSDAVHRPRSHAVRTASIDPSLIETAESLHRDLLEAERA